MSQATAAVGSVSRSADAFSSFRRIDAILGERAGGSLAVAGLCRVEGAGFGLVALAGDAHEAPHAEGEEGGGAERCGDDRELLSPHELSDELAEGVLVRGDELARLKALQILDQLLGGRVPLVGLACHGALDDRDEVARDLRRDLRQGGGRFRLHLVEELAARDAVVRANAREHVIEQGAEGVDVRALVDDLPARLLRRHEGRRPDHGARAGVERAHRGIEDVVGMIVRLRGNLRARRVEILREPPVDDDRFAEGSDQHVGRLEVAVQDPLAVRVGDGLGDVDDVLQEQEPLLE